LSRPYLLAVAAPDLNFISFDHVVAKRCEERYHPILVDLLALDDEPIVAGGLIVGGAEAHISLSSPKTAFDR
jgi:hypothetical protein